MRSFFAQCMPLPVYLYDVVADVGVNRLLHNAHEGIEGVDDIVHSLWSVPWKPMLACDLFEQWMDVIMFLL